LGFTPELRDRVQSMLLAQRPDEIEHVLKIGQEPNFIAKLRGTENPSMWLHSHVRAYRRAQTNEHIATFCNRFGFDSGTERHLCELPVERARRLMQSWSPAGPGSQAQRQHEFLTILAQSLQDNRIKRASRAPQISMVANHARILEEWSDASDDDDDQDFGEASTVYERDKDFVAFDADGLPPENFRILQKDPPAGDPASAKQFVIHSTVGTASRTQSNATANKLVDASTKETAQAHPFHPVYRCQWFNGDD